MSDFLRPRRNRTPVVRYGIDVEVSSDDDEEETLNDEASDSQHATDDDFESNDGGSESEDEPVDDGNAGWSRVFSPNDVAPAHQFQGCPGWKSDVIANCIEDYLHIFLPDSLIEKLCHWTNKRARIHITNKDVSWTYVDVTLEEMKVFLGLSMAMGIIKKPTVESYWSTEDLMKTPYFSSCMSRNRYKQILRFIRFSDPCTANPEEKNSRLKQLDDAMLEICTQYVPGQELSLDESLLLHKGNLSFKMFIRTKRARFGIKLFLLCDSQGYLLAFEIYYGSQTFTCNEPETGDLSKSELIVVHLLAKAELLDKWYIVTLDNWYSSVRLAEYLFSRKTYMRGTVRSNRGIPSSLKSLPLQVHDTAYFRKDNQVLAVKYVDKKEIFLLSTVDKAGEIEKSRYLRGGALAQYPKPEAIETYNKTMGGVDVTDQYLAGIGIVRKSHVWFKKMGLHLLQRLVLNAYLLYKRKQGIQRLSFLDFSKRVIPLLTNANPEQGGFQHVRQSAQRPLPTTHYPEDVTPSSNAQARSRIKCRQCSLQGKRKDTYYRCSSCPGNPGLCVTPCFRQWHENMS